MLLLTVLALVSLELRRAATGRLVAHGDRAVASIQTVVLASVEGASGPCEAFGASAGWSTWDDRHESLTVCEDRNDIDRPLVAGCSA